MRVTRGRKEEEIKPNKKKIGRGNKKEEQNVKK